MLSGQYCNFPYHNTVHNNFSQRLNCLLTVSCYRKRALVVVSPRSLSLVLFFFFSFFGRGLYLAIFPIRLSGKIETLMEKTNYTFLKWQIGTKDLKFTDSQIWQFGICQSVFNLNFKQFNIYKCASLRKNNPIRRHL